MNIISYLGYVETLMLQFYLFTFNFCLCFYDHIQETYPDNVMDCSLSPNSFRVLGLAFRSIIHVECGARKYEFIFAHLCVGSSFPRLQYCLH